jgi:hypothetical protein
MSIKPKSGTPLSEPYFVEVVFWSAICSLGSGALCSESDTTRVFLLEDAYLMHSRTLNPKIAKYSSLIGLPAAGLTDYLLAFSVLVITTEGCVYNA